MKSSKLIEVFKNGSLVIPIFFLKNYEKFKLELDEFIFLMYLYNLGDKSLFDPNRYCDELNKELSNIMAYIDKLTDKGFIQVITLKNDKNLMEEVISLEGFFNKLTLLTIDEVNNEKVVSSVFEVIEKEFGRTLSPIEYEIIKAWLENDISEDVIKEAIKEATFNGVSNLRYIDKILYEWGKLGVKSVKDVDDIRKKRKEEKNNTDNIDLDIVEWNWFDDDE